jgi:hypothetical protein
MTSNPPKRLISYNIYIYKKPGMSEADFHQHVTSINTPIITSVLQKYGGISYSVVGLPNPRLNIWLINSRATGPQ